MRDARVALPTSRRSSREEVSYGRLVGARRLRTQTLQTAGAKGASGKKKSIIVNRVYYTQLGFLGGIIHEAAIVYLGADERTIESEHHRPVLAQRWSRKSS
jgi:hypothetical protein